MHNYILLWMSSGQFKWKWITKPQLSRLTLLMKTNSLDNCAVLHPVGLINSHWVRGLRAKLKSLLEAFCSLESDLNMNNWLQIVLVWTYKMMGNYCFFSPGGFFESHPFLIEIVFMGLLLTGPLHFVWSLTVLVWESCASTTVFPFVLSL